MNDLTIRYRMPLGQPQPAPQPCVWCGELTPMRADTPFRPDLGAVSLHLFCSQWIRDAYRAMQDGRALDAEEQAGMRRFAVAVAQLGSGE